MRVRIGNQTAASAANVLQPFDYAVARGFDAFEWFPDKKISGEGWTEGDISKAQREIIRERACAGDISLSFHTPLPSHPRRSPGDELLAAGLEFARDIGARIFNLHFAPDIGARQYAELILPLVETLSQSGMRLSIENTIDTTPEDMNSLFSHIRDIKIPLASVGMCLDVGHANLCRVTRNDYLRYLALLDPRVPIIHLHLHENYGDHDAHLTFFTGPSAHSPAGIEGLLKRLRDRGFSGNIILEQWPRPPDLLDIARSRLIQMIGYSTQAAERHDGDFASEIAEANKTFTSWRKRLEWILDVLDRPGDIDPGVLVYLAIYLRFLGTGELECKEDTGHHRPYNHALISQKIYRRLIGLTTPENTITIRKIYPWLPSFDSRFMRSEPLTRIRDIAHRNDIPQDLKKEIKVTLQNKLHRSAGPEDLHTSEALLKRISDPAASYSPGFVREFTLFHDELKEFFNARSLEEQLLRLIENKEDAGEPELISDFLLLKKTFSGLDGTLDLLSLLTKLRRSLAGRRTRSADASDQRLQLIDIGLEDFSFVLLSSLVNYFDSSSDGHPWLPALDSLSLTVENLRLAGIDPDECVAIESEIRAWSRGFTITDRDALLRLKASLERCRRLAENYCEMLMDLFHGRVERLGCSLGVSEHAIRNFVEGEIRGHPVFQLSKIVSILMQRIRTLASLPQWEVIVPGRTSGLAVAAAEMGHLPAADRSERLIAILDRIEVDEDIPRAVAGIIVGHQTPLLSHLAVRARAAGTVFVSLDDKELLATMKTSAGRKVILDASADKVDLLPSDTEKPLVRPEGTIYQQGRCPKAMLPRRVADILPVEEVTPETGGGKAFGARMLAELSGRSLALFRTPPGLVIPFGVMEEVIESVPDTEKEYRSVIGAIDDMKDADLAVSSARLREMVLRLPVPNYLVKTITDRFGREERLIVRSSSNCEDGGVLSGAGVYDSVANVSSRKLVDAVLTVWASLWNLTSIMDRKNAVISQSDAHMAVLIQPMIPSEYSFIMHTVNPVNGNTSEILIECASGLGDTLASGRTRGSPYRIVYDKTKREVRLLCFASFSTAALPGAGGSIARRTIDCSSVRLSTDADFRRSMMTAIGEAGKLTEDAFGGPQDIEGLIFKGSLFLVQARPQKGSV